MCEEDLPIDFELVFKNEEDREKEDCACKFNVIDNDDSSLDSIDEVEIENVSLWESILRKSADKFAPYREWVREKKAEEPGSPALDGPVEFLENEIFPLLLPAMRIMLIRAEEWDALRIQKCRFNGIDFLAEVLWNRNPRYPNRSTNWLDLFSIPNFKLFLKSHPRPIFPKSWLWSREEGALIIQKWVRGWLVRKKENVQEMRLFWKAIIAENELEAAELGITYAELLEKRRRERITPCDRVRNKLIRKN